MTPASKQRGFVIFGRTGGGGGPPPPTPPSGGYWPLQTTSFLSAHPGHGGFGYESYGGSGRHTTPGNVTVFFLNDLGTGTVNNAWPGKTRFRQGTLRGFASVAGPKICVPIKSGIINLGSDFRIGSYCDFYGQAAPGDGLILRGTIPQVVESFAGAYPTSSHVRFWHMDVRPGDDVGGVDPSNRDGGNFGGAGSDGTGASKPVPSYNLFINCNFNWSIDEIFEEYAGSANNGICYTVFGEALHKSANLKTINGVPTYVSHGYGSLFGGAYRNTNLSIQRCIYAHMAGRQAMAASLQFAFVNNLIYNPGDTDGNFPQCVRLISDYDSNSPDPGPFRSNIVGNVFLAGPNTPSTVYCVAMDPGGSDVASRQPAGSTGYIAKNAAYGITAASQLALKAGTFPSAFDSGSLITAAWPSGFGADMSGIVDIEPGVTNPNSFSQTAIQNFVTNLAAVVGPRPNKTGAYSRARTIANHCVAGITGVGDEGACVNSVAGTSDPNNWPTGIASGTRYSPNAGGYPTITSIEIDPFSPGAEWHAAFPVNASGEPDDSIITSGTFSNSRSKVGYTVIEAFFYELHLFRGGI